MIPVKTRIKVNKTIYRLGFKARSLLIVLSAILILGTVLIGLLGIIGAVITAIIIYGFLRLSRFLKDEIEKGNLNPIDDYFSNMNKPNSLYDDDIIETLKSERCGKTK